MSYPPGVPAGSEPPEHPYQPSGAQQGAPVCYRHPDRATGLTCTRCGRHACPECLREASVGYQCLHCVSEGRSAIREPTTIAGATAVSRPLWTYGLIALNVAIFLWTVLQSRSLMGNYNSALFSQWAMYTPSAATGELWRLFTAGFLHFGPIHLLLNMYALYIIGREIEPVLGHTRYAGLYLLSLVGGTVLVYLFGGLNTLVAGASTAVFGLMGAFALIARKLRVDVRGILVIIGINVVITFTIPGISIWGHLGGLLVGLAVTAGLIYSPRRSRTLWQVATMVAVLLLLIALTAVRTVQLTAVLA